MDRVRLGRALGYGTRHAAKTLAAVAEAAVANPPQSREAQGAAAPEVLTPTANSRPRAAASNGDGGNRLRQVQAGAAQARRAGRSVWGPLAAFSGALWLRVTGLFFGLMALAMANGAWRLRGALHSGPGTSAPHRLWAFLGFAALFGYFAVSSFVRASLRERRAAR